MPLLLKGSNGINPPLKKHTHTHFNTKQNQKMVMDCDTFSFVLPRPLSISTAHRHPALKRFKRRIRGGGGGAARSQHSTRARDKTERTSYMEPTRYSSKYLKVRPKDGFLYLFDFQVS